ncbi:beta-amyrin 28-monooxygenase-like isoform X3 [Typha angustifolia]|uniref:beta-amyrin 28-monooxygenase-like isoform X3 n=1 Tax=Typha angustifolia TaxID=59011 RepID=UPI003C30B996
MYSVFNPEKRNLAHARHCSSSSSLSETDLARFSQHFAGEISGLIRLTIPHKNPPGRLFSGSLVASLFFFFIAFLSRQSSVVSFGLSERRRSKRRSLFNSLVLPLMKSLTFDIICSLIFGLERGEVREGLDKDFDEMVAGMWAIPVNLPFTAFNKSLRASSRVRKVLTGIIREKKAKLEQGLCSSDKDLITYLCSLGGALTEEEIVDNARLVLIAGHDTSSVLITFMIRHLANDPDTLAGIIHEQEEIAKNKALGDALTWDDLAKMKYTWCVAMETLRMIPPVFGSFRKALKDLEFEGYSIPKGWQVFWGSSVTQLDAKNFHEPRKFDPARFENQSSIPPYCFVAFGGGPRLCPGIEFARIETLVMMYYLVSQFKWKLCCKDDTFKRDPMPSPMHGLPIELELKKCHAKAHV